MSLSLLRLEMHPRLQTLSCSTLSQLHMRLQPTPTLGLAMKAFGRKLFAQLLKMDANSQQL